MDSKKNQKQDFAEWLKLAHLDLQVQKRQRISLDEFADYIGYSRSLISKWMNGNGLPTKDGIIRLAELFNESIYDIFEMERPDPILKRISNIWENIPHEKKLQLAEEAEQYQVNNHEFEATHRKRKTATNT